jgi:hypothetical protein
MVDHIKKFCRGGYSRDRLRQTENLTEGSQVGPPFLNLLDLVSARIPRIETHQNLQSDRDREILELLNLLSARNLRIEIY